jgi:hypothetical protein
LFVPLQLILLTLLAPFVYLVVTWLWAYIHTRDIEINLNLDFSVLPKTARFEESLLLTFKTGSAVIYDRTPIQVQHLLDSQSNTWQADGWNEYIPNQLFYSDAEEWIGKAYFRDALANVSSEMKTFEGFQEYHRIHELRVSQYPRPPSLSIADLLHYLSTGQQPRPFASSRRRDSQLWLAARQVQIPAPPWRCLPTISRHQVRRLDRGRYLSLLEPTRQVVKDEGQGGSGSR